MKKPELHKDSAGASDGTRDPALGPAQGWSLQVRPQWPGGPWDICAVSSQENAGGGTNTGPGKEETDEGRGCHISGLPYGEMGPVASPFA